MTKRKTSKANPLNLKIGDVVIAKQSSSVGYDDKGNRIIYKNARTSPLCFIVGVKRKALGTYVKANSYGSFDGYDGDDPPSLDVSSYVLFYECRERIDSKPFLVHPDDIKKREFVPPFCVVDIPLDKHGRGPETDPAKVESVEYQVWDACNITVSAWKTMSEAGAALLLVQREYDRKPECNCDLTTKAVGDGCAVCNPELAADLEKEGE